MEDRIGRSAVGFEVGDVYKRQDGICSGITRVTFVVIGNCPAITCFTRLSSTSTLGFLAIVIGLDVYKRQL